MESLTASAHQYLLAAELRGAAAREPSAAGTNHTRAGHERTQPAGPSMIGLGRLLERGFDVLTEPACAPLEPLGSKAQRLGHEHHPRHGPPRLFACKLERGCHEPHELGIDPGGTALDSKLRRAWPLCRREIDAPTGS